MKSNCFGPSTFARALISTLRISAALVCVWPLTSLAQTDVELKTTASVSTALMISSDGADAATADSLFRVNLETGASTLIGPLGAVGGAFEDVEGLALDDAGKLYGVDDDTKTLLTINTVSGRATAVNNSQGNTRIATGANNAQDLSIAFGCNGQLYGVAARSKSFYRVSTTTGAFEIVGASGNLGATLTDFTSSAGQLFGLGEDALYTINADSGTSTLVGGYGGGVRFVEGGGIGAEANGQLWAVGERRDGSGRALPSQIYRIDRDTGAATFVSTTNVQGAESLNIGVPSCVRGPGVPVVQAPSINFWGASLLLVLLLASSLIYTRR
jgi:hypothetical protein